MTDQEETTTGTAKHIRPTRRKPRDATANASPSMTLPTDHVAVEQTRKCMESWMGLGEFKSTKPSAAVVSSKAEKEITSSSPSKTKPAGGQSAAENTATPKSKPSTRPAGILKAPKYSKLAPAKSTGDAPPADPIAAATTPTTVPSSSSKPVVCNDIIVERDPTRPIPKVKPFRRQQLKQPTTIDDVLLSDGEGNTTFDGGAIEGYTPTSSSAAPQAVAGNKTSSVQFESEQKQLVNAADNATQSSNHQKDEDIEDTARDNDVDHEKEEKPLYINTLADLMEAAGETLPDPSTPITSDTQMVEANLEFSVMTQEEYDSKLATLKQEREDDRQDQMKIFMGKLDIFGDDDNDDATQDENDDDAMMELLMGEAFNENDDDGNRIHYDDEDDNRPESKPRAFRLLWDALSTWMTPQTVAWVKALQENDDSLFNSKEWAPMFDQSDIGASRCAGVMAMLKLYISGCMEELHYPTDERRRAEKGLTDISRTFDYSRENPKLHVSHWKAMTCILLDMVMGSNSGNTSHQVPPSVAVLDMTLDEYRYLTQKTVSTFIPSSRQC